MRHLAVAMATAKLMASAYMVRVSCRFTQSPFSRAGNEGLWFGGMGVCPPISTAF